MPPTGTIVLATMPSITGKEEIWMLTLAEFIAVTGVVIAAFGLGYRLGRDKRKNVKDTRE